MRRMQWTVFGLLFLTGLAADAQNTVPGKPPVKSADVQPDAWATFGEDLEEQGMDVVIRKAEGGDAAAQCLLARRYAIGFLVGENPAKALEWYRKAASGGNAEAQYRLGGIYAGGGEGVAPDMKQAVAYYRMAAVQNHKEAQWELGFCYASGNGLEKNIALAYVWFSLSGENGYAIGRSESVRMAGQLAPEQLKRAQDILQKTRDELAAKAAAGAKKPV